MMAYEGSENPRDNFGKFIYQHQPETKGLVRKLKRIQIELYRQNVSLLMSWVFANGPEDQGSIPGRVISKT